MNEIVVNKIICDVINGKLKYEENSDAFSEIENKELTLYINYLLCDIYHKLGDSAQMIEIDDCFELNMCNKERYYLIKEFPTVASGRWCVPLTVFIVHPITLLCNTNFAQMLYTFFVQFYTSKLFP